MNQNIYITCVSPYSKEDAINDMLKVTEQKKNNGYEPCGSHVTIRKWNKYHNIFYYECEQSFKKIHSN